MAGESITQMIFFIGAVVITAGVIGVLINSVQSVAASYVINSKTLADQLKSEITIINDPIVIPYDSVLDNYTFFVKNTGKTTLDPTTVSMLIDGSYVNTTNRWTVMDGGTTWYPSYVLRLNYTTATRFNRYTDHSVRIIAGNGISDTMSFICADPNGNNYCQ